MDNTNNVSSKKLRMAMINSNISLSQLAKSINCSPSNLSNKFKRNNLHETEIRQIADKLGYDLEITLTSKDTGEKI